jgi:fructose/tagatose bisphosphate aldolase
MQIKKSRNKPVRRKGKGRAQATRAVVVHSLAAARAALAAAKAEGARAVMLVSPRDAAAYMGVGFFAALADAARAEFPEIAIEAAMDCGDDPGWALSALRMGFNAVVLRGNPRARTRVAAIARMVGARVLRGPPGRGTGRRGGGEK